MNPVADYFNTDRQEFDYQKRLYQDLLSHQTVFDAFRFALQNLHDARLELENTDNSLPKESGQDYKTYWTLIQLIKERHSYWSNTVVSCAYLVVAEGDRIKVDFTDPACEYYLQAQEIVQKEQYCKNKPLFIRLFYWIFW